MGVIASFGHMIPDDVIDAFSLRTMLVMHPSLLPKYRGACPIQHSILNGDTETGISVIEISKRAFDAGSILYQKKVEQDPLVDDFTKMQLVLSEMGGEGVDYVLENFDKIKGQDQGDGMTKAPMIKPEFGLIQASELTAKECILRFNSLNGSNTRPRMQIKNVENE